MTQVLVTYFSSTGNTKALAEAVAEGVQAVEDVECVLKTVSQTTNDDWYHRRLTYLFWADGVAGQADVRHHRENLRRVGG
jgi:hypothetical protein